jgi:hypothetical protein
MRDSEFVDALRMRLRLPIVPANLACFCGSVLPDADTGTQHLLQCSSVTGVTWKDRHDAVCAKIGRALNAAAIRYQREPAFYLYADGSAKRPDFTVYFGERTVAYDVTIVAPEIGAGVAARKAAEGKIEKHAAAVEEHGHEFRPLAFESAGHCDPAFQDLCKMIRSAAAPWCASTIVDELRESVPAAIAANNARMVRNAIGVLRRRASFAFSAPSNLQ